MLVLNNITRLQQQQLLEQQQQQQLLKRQQQHPPPLRGFDANNNNNWFNEPNNNHLKGKLLYHKSLDRMSTYQRLSFNSWDPSEYTIYIRSIIEVASKVHFLPWFALP